MPIIDGRRVIVISVFLKHILSSSVAGPSCWQLTRTEDGSCSEKQKADLFGTDFRHCIITLSKYNQNKHSRMRAILASGGR